MELFEKVVSKRVASHSKRNIGGGIVLIPSYSIAPYLKIRSRTFFHLCNNLRHSYYLQLIQHVWGFIYRRDFLFLVRPIDYCWTLQFTLFFIFFSFCNCYFFDFSMNNFSVCSNSFVSNAAVTLRFSSSIITKLELLIYNCVKN